MKFKIVEGDTDKLNRIYEDFKVDFLDASMSIDDLMRKYDVSFKNYNKLRKRACEEFGLKQKPISRAESNHVIHEKSYIHRYGKKWAVVKTVNHERVIFGIYEDFEEAKNVRDLLLANNWDKKVLEK